MTEKITFLGWKELIFQPVSKLNLQKKIQIVCYFSKPIIYSLKLHIFSTNNFQQRMWIV